MNLALLVLNQQTVVLQVHSTAKRIVRVAALTASTSDSVTTTAARCTLRGLGDRIRLDCPPGGGSASVRWMTIYVGVRRYPLLHYMPIYRIARNKSCFFFSLSGIVRLKAGVIVNWG